MQWLYNLRLRERKAMFILRDVRGKLLLGFMTELNRLLRNCTRTTVIMIGSHQSSIFNGKIGMLRACSIIRQ